MPSLPLRLLPLVALSAPAAAHAGPCSMPAALAERVCADPALAALDAALVAKEAEAQRVTARPASWRAHAAQFRALLAQERNLDDDKPIGRDAIAGRIRDEIGELDHEIARARGLTANAGRDAILGTACLAKWFSGCKVPGAGVIRDGKLSILYQLQSGASESDGGGMGVMLWDASGPGVPKLIGWSFEGVWLRTPQLDAERGLLWVPGTMSGTGEGNADLLYQKQGERWVEIELVSWRDDLDKRLPKGVGAWHGVQYDLTSLGADTDLWRDADANCCPTAGRANLGFSIAGDRLRLDTISAQLGGPAERWQDF